MADDRKKVVAFPFSGEEPFPEWSFKMAAYFRHHKLDKIIDKIQDTTVEVDEANNRAVFDILVMNCSGKALSILQEVALGNGRAAWRALHSKYAARRPAREASLQGELFLREWRSDDTITTFRADIMRLRRNLLEMGQKSVIPDRVICNLVLTRVPTDRFGTLVSSRFLVDIDDDRAYDLESLFDSLSVAETTFTSGKADDTTKAFYVPDKKSQKTFDSSRSPGGSGGCYFCGRKGHQQKECRDRIKASAAAHDEAKRKPRKGGAATAAAAVQMADESFSAIVLEPVSGTALSAFVSAGTQARFCLDSGSTKHIVNDQSLFNSFSAIDGAKPRVKVASGQLIDAQGVGTVRLTVRDAQGKECHIDLTDVLYFPTFTVNLLSQTRLTRNRQGKPTGNSFKDGPNGAMLIFASGRQIPLRFDNRLHWLEPTRAKDTQAETGDMANAAASIGGSNTKPVSITMMHDRLGHLNYRDLLQLSEVADGVYIDKTDTPPNLCGDCALGKSARKAVPKAAAKRATVAGQLIHSDLNGPMPDSVGGKKYVVCFIDDATRWSSVYLMRNKSELSDCFLKFIQDMRVVGTKDPLVIGDGSTLHSDNGGEYRSSKFEQLCSSRGIQQTFSPPHTQACNGISERFWNTVLDMARAMIIDADLDKNMWGAAIKHATFLRNRSPTSVLGGITPFQALLGVKPDLSALRKFGSPAFVHVERELRDKWDPKARKGVYIGCEPRSMTHLIFIPETKKVVETVHVDIDERASISTASNVEIPDPFENETDQLIGHGNTTDPSVAVGSPGDAVVVGEGEQQMQPVTEGEGQHEAHPRAPATPHRAADVSVQPRAPATLPRAATVSVQPHTAITTPRAAAASEALDTATPAPQQTTQPADAPRDVLLDGDSDDEVSFQPHQPPVDQHTDDDEDPLIAGMAFVSHVWNDATVADPLTVEEAFALPNGVGTEWRDAYDDEINSHKENKTWTVMRRDDIPRSAKLLKSKVVLKTKYNADGSINKRKVRVVAKGFSQRKGIDYDEIFSPVVHMETQRTILALAAKNNLHVHQIDFKTAFLNPDVEEELYMELPSGMPDTDGQGHKLAARLNKCIYGLKQASRTWYEHLSTWMVKDGFTRSLVDPCLYIKNIGKDNAMFVTVWVDDTIIASRNESDVMALKERLKANFKMSDLGPINFCLGIEVTRTPTTIAITQRKFVGEILERFGMSDCKAVTTPMVPHSTMSKLQPTQNPVIDDGEPFDPTRYRELVGCLMYLVTCTRPDIAASVGQLARYMSAPSKHHWVAAKHVLRYLKGTADIGPTYSSSVDDANILHGYVDADWGSDTDTRRSTTGYVFRLNGAAISWGSKIQHTVALSTAEAEYMAASAATQEALHLRLLLTDLGYAQPCTVLFEDNQPCIDIAKNPVTSSRTKHIDIRVHFVREHIKSGEIVLKYLATEFMIADCLTKNLDRIKVEKFRRSILGVGKQVKREGIG